MFGHTLLGFMPKYFGIVPEHADERLQGRLIYVFVNGSAAVALFFVLSGYVLTRRYCLTGDVRILLKGAIKRWPRLMGPVFVAVMVSYALFYFHLYYFEQAGAELKSFWLVQFAGAFHHAGLPEATSASIHLRDALLQGSVTVFLRGDWLFDGSLWTMQPELIGSFLAFGAAPILFEARKSSASLVIGLVLLSIAVMFFVRPDLAAFPIGVGMAALIPRERRMKAALAWPLLALAFYLLGYPEMSIGAYAPFRLLEAIGMPATYPEIVGAIIVIVVIETFEPIRKPLSGRVSAFLGELSFPIYLLHALIICSIGCKVFLMAGPLQAFAVTLVASVVASLPLIKFNNWWVARVSRLADLLLRREASARVGQDGWPHPAAP